MEENKQEKPLQKKKEEVDVKLPLIGSFILLAVFMSIGLSNDRFVYWGVKEQVISAGEVGVFGIMAYHLSLLVMILIFIFFGHSKRIHWLSFIIIFGALGYFAFNNGSCITEKGIYERDLGHTVFYDFKEIKRYEVAKNETMANAKSFQYKIQMKSGKEFTFIQKTVNQQLLLKMNHSILMAKSE